MLREDRREAGGQQQRVAVAQRDLERVGEMQQHLPARSGTACLDEAQVARGDRGVERELELAELAPLAPRAQDRAGAGRGGERAHARTVAVRSREQQRQRADAEQERREQPQAELERVRVAVAAGAEEDDADDRDAERAADALHRAEQARGRARLRGSVSERTIVVSGAITIPMPAPTSTRPGHERGDRPVRADLADAREQRRVSGCERERTRRQDAPAVALARRRARAWTRRRRRPRGS